MTARPEPLGFAAPRADAASPLWARLDELVERAPRLSDLRFHGVQYVASRRMRALGRPVPHELALGERGCALLELVAPLVLEKARDAYDGPMLLMKGPEVAARYPDPAARPYRDLDLLVADAPTAQRQLVEFGFEPWGEPSRYVGIHHLRPLRWPGLPLVVELHERPKWPARLVPPPSGELLALGVPASLDVDGVRALPRAEHAVLVAAHAWAHAPLGRLVHLVDVAALADGVTREELRAVARRWGVGRLWATTIAAVDHLFTEGRRPVALRVWARHLESAREPTVLATHLQDLLAPAWALRAPSAAAAVASTLLDDLTPAPEEPWVAKVRRGRSAFRDAFTRRSEHAEALERGHPAQRGGEANGDAPAAKRRPQVARRRR